MWESVNESLAWLEKRVEICQRLPVEWGLTRDARLNSLRNRRDDKRINVMHEYIHITYPCLKQPGGYSLVSKSNIWKFCTFIFLRIH